MPALTDYLAHNGATAKAAKQALPAPEAAERGSVPAIVADATAARPDAATPAGSSKPATGAPADLGDFSPASHQIVVLSDTADPGPIEILPATGPAGLREIRIGGRVVATLRAETLPDVIEVVVLTPDTPQTA